MKIAAAGVLTALLGSCAPLPVPSKQDVKKAEAALGGYAYAGVRRAIAREARRPVSRFYCARETQSTAFPAICMAIVARRCDAWHLRKASGSLVATLTRAAKYASFRRRWCAVIRR